MIDTTNIAVYSTVIYEGEMFALSFSSRILCANEILINCVTCINSYFVGREISHH